MLRRAVTQPSPKHLLGRCANRGEGVGITFPQLLLTRADEGFSW